MGWLKHAAEVRRVFWMMDKTVQLNHVREWRAATIQFLDSAKRKAPRPLSAEARTAYRLNDIDVEWNLDSNDDAVTFCLAARSSGKLSESENAAVNLLRACIATEEEGAPPDWILDALAAIDSDNVAIGKNTRAGQSEKASKPRSPKLGDGEISLDEIIKHLAGQRDSLGDFIPAPDLWHPLCGALEEALADPVIKRHPTKPRQSVIYFLTYQSTEDKTGESKRGHLTRGTFETKIGKIRK